MYNPEMNYKAAAPKSWPAWSAAEREAARLAMRAKEAAEKAREAWARVEAEADVSREAEMWEETREMGALTIRVEDLGAALEANEQGRHAVFVAGLASEGKGGLLYEPRGGPDIQGPIVAVFPNYVHEVSRCAAHLARLALGEVSP